LYKQARHHGYGCEAATRSVGVQRLEVNELAPSPATATFVVGAGVAVPNAGAAPGAAEALPLLTMLVLLTEVVRTAVPTVAVALVAALMRTCAAEN
jgi:hypothetical protein